MTDMMKDISARWRRCWNIAPDIYSLLKESKALGSARRKIMTYLEATEVNFRNDYFEISNWDYIQLEDALVVLRNLFSKRSEMIAQTSPLKFLWEAARDGDSEVADDFIEEFEHLFRAMKGSARVYPSHMMEGVVSPDFEKYRGREAAVKRSDFLDVLGDKMDLYIERYPHGLRPEIEERRAEHKKRILAVFGAIEDDWIDYKWQFRNVIKNKKGLERLLQVVRITNEQEKAIKLAIDNHIPFGVTPHYLHLMDPEPGSYDFAVRRQVFPPLSYVKAMMAHKSDRSHAFDFMREHDTSPVEHITRRYVKVCIMKPYETCPQICVYCQRNWQITSPFAKSAQVSRQDIDKAIKWVSRHRHIMDILVTGGDPLILDNEKLDHLLARLAEIDHLKSIRIASRIPITVPQRIDDELIEILAKYNEPFKRLIYMVTHFEHPYEICRETAEAIHRLRMRGIKFYNQQVFTFANSKRFETVALRIALKMIGVDPYYLFNLKGKSEMLDYAAPVARIQQELREEARVLPGIFRTDEPVFNVPFLGKNHMRSRQDHEFISILPDGRRVYAFHPWEKNIRGVNSYIYKDVSIKAYLSRLEDLGEDPEDYKSIWYYY
jgi:lysine 2,3-aminomutase